jgi:hypothetical protein
MKYGVLVLGLLTACASERGQFVDRGLFNNSPFVTAKAKTPDEARARALAAVPEGFEPDEAFKVPVISCGLPGEAPVFDEKTLESTRCASGLYRVDVALLPASGAEREAILRTRADGVPATDGERAPAGE